MSLLPVKAAHELADCPEDQQWLIEGLWADQAVGIVGGEPKCCKSFLALDLAVAVASGAPCLRRYRVARTGRVLLFNAEDALHVVRRRLRGIGLAAGVPLEGMDIQVITAPSLRLDVRDDQKALANTVGELRPALLILDPFVRLHRIDENVAAEVSPLLGYLRELQRRFQVSVVVVHHARKGAGKARQGQALRGTSEFHAWGDSNLYLRRVGDELVMSIEHRASPSTNGVQLKLAAEDDIVGLEVADDEEDQDGAAGVAHPGQRPGAGPSATERVMRFLRDASEPQPAVAVQRGCRLRAATVWQALRELGQAGQIEKAGGRYRPAHFPLPLPANP